MVVVAREPTGVSHVIDIDKFSNLGKLLRVTAYVHRYLELSAAVAVNLFTRPLYSASAQPFTNTFTAKN